MRGEVGSCVGDGYWRIIDWLMLEFQVPTMAVAV